MKPLIPSIQRLLSEHEDDEIEEMCSWFLFVVGKKASELYEPDDIGTLIVYYCEHPDANLLGTMIFHLFVDSVTLVKEHSAFSKYICN